MKVFVTKSYPTTTFIYKVLNLFHKTCSREEIMFYINQIWKENKE